MYVYDSQREIDIVESIAWRSDNTEVQIGYWIVPRRYERICVLLASWKWRTDPVGGGGYYNKG